MATLAFKKDAEGIYIGLGGYLPPAPTGLTASSIPSIPNAGGAGVVPVNIAPPILIGNFPPNTPVLIAPTAPKKCGSCNSAPDPIMGAPATGGPVLKLAGFDGGEPTVAIEPAMAFPWWWLVVAAVVGYASRGQKRGR